MIIADDSTDDSTDDESEDDESENDAATAAERRRGGSLGICRDRSYHADGDDEDDGGNGDNEGDMLPGLAQDYTSQGDDGVREHGKKSVSCKRQGAFSCP